MQITEKKLLYRLEELTPEISPLYKLASVNDLVFWLSAGQVF
jgi:hypothetical protein